MNTLSTIIINAVAEIETVNLACAACGCECPSHKMQSISDYSTYLCYTRDYSAEWHDLFCPACHEWITDEYQPSDPVDAAFDKLDR